MKDKRLDCWWSWGLRPSKGRCPRINWADARRFQNSCVLYLLNNSQITRRCGTVCHTLQVPTQFSIALNWQLKRNSIHRGQLPPVQLLWNYNHSPNRWLILQLQACQRTSYNRNDNAAQLQLQLVTSLLTKEIKMTLDLDSLATAAGRKSQPKNLQSKKPPNIFRLGNMNVYFQS